LTGRPALDYNRHVFPTDREEKGAQHFMVSDSAYESLGQFRLGLPDANPMG